MHIQFQLVQQCIQISTRINSSSVHTYIFVCFIRNPFNNPTWCQNRGCSYISSRRRIYRSNPAVSCISPSILNISTVELQFYYSKEGGRQRSVQSAIGSRVFRAVLPGRIFILGGSKALQAPRAVSCAAPVQFPVLPSILPGRNFILCGLRCPADPCEDPVLQYSNYFHRISTCNVHSSTKVSGLRNLLSILCLQRKIILPLELILPSIQN